MTANAASQVNRGALAAIFDPNLTRIPNPVVQCVQVKPLPAQSGNPERYRVVFSDISHFIQAMLATQMNYLVTEGKLKRGCFVRLKEFNPNTVKGKKILIILELEVVEELGVCDKIGEPRSLEERSAEEETKGQPTSIPSNGFYGNKPVKTENRSLPSRGPAPPSSAHANIYPIEALSPYSHKWTIKARCTNKSPIKTWHNREKFKAQHKPH